MRAKLKYGLGMAVLLGILLYLKTLVPPETDWRQTYSGMDKIPFGTWILQHSVEDLFPGSQIKVNTKSLYERWTGDSTNSTVFIITNHFNPAPPDLNALLQKVKKGSQVLIASEMWPKTFTDSLNITFKNLYRNVLDSVITLQNLTGKSREKEYRFKRLIQSGWFELSDTTAVTPLGKGNDHVNYVQVRCGKGSFFLHAQPQVFTNYHILYNDHHYLEEVLASLPESNGEIEWDEYYKPFGSRNRSPIKIILSLKALRAAYWTLLTGLLLYVLTNIRRRQRPIPILPPKTNLSLDFVRTVGLLYFHQKNHQDLIKKIFVSFSEYVYSKYFIRHEFTSSFYQKLATKSAVGEQLIARIFNQYQVLSTKERVYEDELIRFNGFVELFYRESRKASKQAIQKN